MQDLLNRIDEFHRQINALKPLTRHNDDRLWHKLRLEWNYNSNHIEGNTLTYGETYLLLIKGDVTGDHKAQEIDEMRAHDLVVLKVREYAADKSRLLTEADIREWNRIILVRPYWKEAITIDGQPTRKLIEPGSYKKTPNSVLMSNGELFHYATPEETPHLMRELVEWYRAEIAADRLHPVELAAILHYKFVRIHPFDDSNGRTARLLMNYELMRNDFPPVIIKSVDKRGYLLALNKADSGDLNAFVKYAAEQLLWSLELNLRAAKGEDIEDADDVYKEIELWKRQNTANAKDRTAERIKHSWKACLRQIFLTYFEKYQIFDDLFKSTNVTVYTGTLKNMRGVSARNWIDIFDDKVKALNDEHSNLVLRIRILFKGDRNDKVAGFTLETTLEIDFTPDDYQIFIDSKKIGTWQYENEPSNEGISQMINDSIKSSFQKIKSKK